MNALWYFLAFNSGILACNFKLWAFLRYGQWWVPDCLDKRGSTVVLRLNLSQCTLS